MERANPPDLRVLLLLPVARDMQLTRDLLLRSGIAVTTCSDALALDAQLVLGAGAVLVAEESLAQGGLEVLTEALALQPPWSDLPILVFTHEGVDSLVAGDAVAVLGNVTLLERPMRVAAMISAVNSALRARSRQYQNLQQLRMLEAARDAEAETARHKDEFLAMLGHELRNPLAPIRNALHVLSLDDSDVARRKALWDIMMRQVNHMVRLVDDLLDSSRMSQGKIELRRETVDLRESIQGAIDLCRPQITSGAYTLRADLGGKVLSVHADPVRIVQVFGNLLNNAAKYGRPGGVIAVDAVVEGDEAVVTITDDGIGIDSELLPRVFDLFAQGKRATHHLHDGLGIGLALVRNLVELHGGSVGAYSEGRDHGARFVVRLPLAVAFPRPVRFLPEETPSKPALAALRVLLVDDNRDAANTLAMVVGSLGMDHCIAYDGEDALRVAREFRPDLACLDIGMPGMDGCEVARRLRADPQHAGMVLVALTGWGDSQDRQRTRAAGFDHHLSKPADIPQLTGLLTQIRAAHQPRA